MNRIEKRFAELKEKGRKGLVTFITAGDPDAAKSAAIFESLPAAGADFIEIGMPFTDPMADGPAIQAAGLRALKNGMNLKGVIKMLQQFRSKDSDTPVILMGYFNPIYAYGTAAFVENAAAAGADGLIIVDLPPEEDMELRVEVEKEGLCLIKLLTPTTTEERLHKVLDGASGFLYYVSITGVTGTKSANIEEVGAHIADIKKHTGLPIAVGFGIKTPTEAAKMAEIADAVVVGSALVQTIEVHENDNNINELISKQVADLARAI